MLSNWLRVLFIAALLFVIVAFNTQQSQAKSSWQYDDPLKQGEYIANIAGCVACHTPFQERYNDLASLPLDEVREFAFNEEIAADRTRLLAGGRYFDLGPAGGVFAPNITPDVATGLGSWSDAEIEQAIRYGVSRDGHQLFPLMPYPVFRNMARSDMSALIAYLRSVPAIEHETSHAEHLPSAPIGGATSLIETPPDPSDTAARGEYLMTNIMTCNDCHTPLNAETGLPRMERYLAGGQPYEGPWGIVYASNLTPHETGLGNWTPAEIKRAMYAGVGRDGRRLILMPWASYSALTPADADAVVHYLSNLPPIPSEIPAISVAPEFEDFVPITPSAERPSANNFAPLSLILLAILVASGIMWLKRS